MVTAHSSTYGYVSKEENTKKSSGVTISNQAGDYTFRLRMVGKVHSALVIGSLLLDLSEN